MATLAAMSGINDIPLALIPSSLYAATANFSLLAIPFFVLAGNIMVVGGIAKRLVDFFNALIGGVAAASPTRPRSPACSSRPCPALRPPRRLPSARRSFPKWSATATTRNFPLPLSPPAASSA